MRRTGRWDFSTTPTSPLWYASLLVSPDPPPNDDSGKKNVWVQLAGYSQLAIIFPAATFIGWLIGSALDHWLHTHWIYILGLILGSMAGFVELIRLVSSSGSK